MTYETIDVVVPAEEGLEELVLQQVGSFCIPSCYLLGKTVFLGFAIKDQPYPIPHIGLYNTNTRELIASSSSSQFCASLSLSDGKSCGVISYRIGDAGVEIDGQAIPSVTCVFYKDTPPERYGMDAHNETFLTVYRGATLSKLSSSAWSAGYKTESARSVHLPYVFLSDSNACKATFIPFKYAGESLVAVSDTSKFSGRFIDLHAGQPLATFTSGGSTLYTNTNGAAACLSSSMTETEASDQLSNRKFRTLYTSDGWQPLLSFKMPDNWVWDFASIKPEGGAYTLCGRVYKGKLEWQFGNLVYEIPTIDTSTLTKIVVASGNKWTTCYKDLDGNVYTEDQIRQMISVENNDGITISKGYTEFVAEIKRASTVTGFDQPLLRWAGEELSKENMLQDGKLKASCEPIYVGMFNLSMSYLVGKAYDIVQTESCDILCEETTKHYYASVREVSPVWYMFASIKDGLVNLVAIEHEINVGDYCGVDVADEKITSPYDLYGPPPVFEDAYLTDVPPSDYRNYNIWMYMVV